MTFRVQSRAPRGEWTVRAPVTDPDVLAGRIEDAAHFPGGHACGLIAPITEADVAQAIHSARHILPVGAQSSLTGGATPMGDLLISTSRLNRILEIGPDFVRVQAGVTLVDLDAALAPAGKYYPPAPTFLGAFVGGTIATNAAGAATFKYGATRSWVSAITVVLATGDVLDLERGVVVAGADGVFDFELAGATRRIRVPRYVMPDMPKLSAGYFARPGMDLIDLFIGSEGTLGVITEATLRIVPRRPSFCLAFVPFGDARAMTAFVRGLRDQARDTWRSADRTGLDVSAIEFMDARCLTLLRDDGADRRDGVDLPARARMALLVTLELAPEMTPSRAFDEIGRAIAADAPDTPLVRLCRMLDAAGVLDDVAIAVPGDTARAEQLIALREAVPAAVNARVGQVKRAIDDRISKMAADVIVPFDKLPDLMAICDAEFGRRDLDFAVWGHISDGNLHPNVLPRSVDDIERGKAAILAIGRATIPLGGAPLAEHGVGRNPIKQQLLEDLYGRQGISEMRAVKRVLDPECRLSPGVLFAPF